MEIESRVELPDGHLVNLSPRPQHQTQYKAYRGTYTATEPSPASLSHYAHRTKPSEVQDPRHSADIMSEKAKATKLPVPKTVADRRDQQNQTPSPTGIPKPSPATFSSGGSGGGPRASGERDRDRDQYWRKLRDRFERDSPLSQRGSYVRSRDTDRKVSPIWPQHKNPASSAREDHVPKLSTTIRTGIPSPSNNKASAAYDNRHDNVRRSDGQKKWRMDGDQWISLDINETTPQKSERTDTTTDSSPHSHPSISPVSAEDSSMTDWEDRFVVHMPTAKDPNPPTMTAQEIAVYQQSLERLRRGARRIFNSDGRLSPRNSLPEGRRSSGGQQQGKPIDQPKAYDRQVQSQPGDDVKAGNEESRGQEHHSDYYCPDEIGKNRISTIWEESPTKPREKRVSHTEDGSFLGCKEINGPMTKSPDEILLFATGEDSTNLQPRPLAVGAKKRLKEKNTTAKRTSRKSEEKAILKEEWAQITRNSKHAQCSKRSSLTMCQDPICSQHEVPRSNSQGSSKENFHPAQSPESHNGQVDGPGDDDVFIITPTITRTLIPTPAPEKKVSAPKPSGLRRPGGIGQSGTGEAVKAVRAKAQVISTPAGLRATTGSLQSKSNGPSLTTSTTTALSSISTAKDKDSKEKGTKDKDKDKEKDKDKDDRERSSHAASNSIRGFIRTTGLARSTGLVRSPTDSLASMLRSGTESLRNRAESLRNSTSRKGSPVSQLPSRDNSGSDRSFRSAKETPTSSAKPSPIKKEIQQANTPPEEKQNTLEEPSPAEKKPPTEKKPPLETKPATEKKPPVAKSSEPEKTVQLEKSPKTEKPEKISRTERLERFKEQARLRRAAKAASKAADKDKVVEIAEISEIAELDGHQVTGGKDSLQPNITDVCDDLRGLQSRDNGASKEGSNTIALSLVFDILVVAVTHVHRLGLQATDSPYAKFAASNVLNMVRHCFCVFSHVYEALSTYQATGKWPKAKNDQAISRFLVELLQAVVYLFILGFGALVISRAAGYLFLVGSWILWFARPFVWAFQCVTRALVT
ncbi:uncharacterized protein N7459_009059 [Penicillium hispanicum]|uniref:uncharacterized protein n=1 Tax=Penicillium hispanicum TaxID=1080232 RepID=UPI002540DDAA|nr:uncharacterized protein N7459_009059 [Penicillium hispanicum]KAJ5569629.1 hypothetical protein N7459_009059 [Penicillium hispanicum]